MRHAKALPVVGGAAMLLFGCAHAGSLRPQLGPLAIAQVSNPPSVLAEDHFRRDRASAVSEQDLRAILETPVYLDETQRLGVLPVMESYEPDRALPEVDRAAVDVDPVEAAVPPARAFREQRVRLDQELHARSLA